MNASKGFSGGIKVPGFSFMDVVDHLGTTYKLKKQMAGEKEKLIKQRPCDLCKRK